MLIIRRHKPWIIANEENVPLLVTRLPMLVQISRWKFVSFIERYKEHYTLNVLYILPHVYSPFKFLTNALTSAVHWETIILKKILQVSAFGKFVDEKIDQEKEISSLGGTRWRLIHQRTENRVGRTNSKVSKNAMKTRLETW